MTAHRPPSRRAPRTAVLATLLVLLTAPLAACSGGDTAATADAAPRGTARAVDEEHNAADLAFVRAMIPRHRQAVALAGLVADGSGSPEVRALAERIAASQRPDITTMTGWLTAWDGPAPDAADDLPPGLADAQGAALDRAFLTEMIRWHETAVELAGAELAEGVHRPARELARAVVTTRTAEIGEMNALLAEG
ncbi:DUF305 domain-containing protein [Streptomyces avicenniae]|uniref:DUF305 domain-containing protein n=1 Tax=Streptomyces avicenniae TaxID=500153 RepID=UPI000699257B|nr:DUF305 domain-containing protein [Streptomyces avicenniae]